ncbi:MAG: NCS1 family transporter [Puniceicoccaceae bacterium 5H]|nr:MAG: NCS1 family transporter [Puniceicoccaceae bacterium 5H]
MSSPKTEYEREPVPPQAQLGFKSFIGQYAGEHTAGTELMLGPLFVAAGVSAADLIVGLLLGNLLAVLSWTLFTTPIATRARLTLYYQLEKICGRHFVVLYNLVNGIAFCFLAGAMITVSATALGVAFHFPMPGLNDFWPNSVGWVLAVLAVGAVISFVAACGYRIVAKVANYAAPWMVLVFIAFGLIGLRDFINETGTTVHGLADVWHLAKTAIWTGGDPLPGQVKFTFWHVLFFAWFCNMAMHIGMSDLSVFRFAKKARYGLATASGMYLGHFLAWIAASVLFALQLHRDPANTDVLPGPLAAGACGLTGVLCVIIAGWTTANPTIYRAGLAFQAIVPRVSRFKVTLATGLLCTIAGMFPAIAMKLLDFVALYGLALMPMGAVIFCDFWLMKRLGMQPYYAELAGKKIHLAPAIAWLATLAICVTVVQMGYIEIFFVSLPGWFIAAFIYLGLSKLIQKPQPQPLQA